MTGVRDMALACALLCAFVCAFAFVVFAGKALAGGVRAWRIKRESGVAASWRHVLARGVPQFFGAAAAFLRNGRCRKLIADMGIALGVDGERDFARGLCSAAIAAALGLFAAILLSSGSLVAAVAAPACVAVAASAWVARAMERRDREIREALPDALRAMGVCFHAGFTLRQTFGQLQRECQGPLRRVFARAAQDLDLGATAEETLETMRASQGAPELAFVAVALEVQHRTGGSMQQVLDAACDSLESELALKRSLRVQTAQAKLSARVVVGATLALVGMLSLATDDFLAPFFSSALGVSMFALAVIMQVAGLLMVRRLLDVQGA